MASVEIITIAGEGITLSRLIARKYRRYIPGYVERVLDVNPHLAEQGPVLAVGTKISMPPPSEAQKAAATPVVSLWD